MKLKAVLVVVLLGIAGVAWWVLKPHTMPTEEQTTQTPTTPESTDKNPNIKYEKVLSVVKVPKGTQLPKVNLSKAIKLERFVNEAGVFSLDSAGKKLDLVLGYALKEDKGTKPLFECRVTESDKTSYTFITSSKTCRGAQAKPKAVAFTLPDTPPSRFHVPMALCQASNGVRYHTLSHMCEQEGDQVMEFIGWIYPAQIVEH